MITDTTNLLLNYKAFSTGIWPNVYSQWEVMDFFLFLKRVRYKSKLQIRIIICQQSNRYYNSLDGMAALEKKIIHIYIPNSKALELL